MMNDSKELGYQYLDTAFTGTSSQVLSGSDCFPFIQADQGTFMSLSDGEL